MNLKYIALFIIDIGTLQEKIFINENFTYEINDFMNKYHKQYEELFNILFKPGILEMFAEENQQILPLNIILGLLQVYSGMDNYLDLLEKIDYESANKINDLALLFLEYHNDLIDLKNAKPSGLLRILH